MTDRLNPKTERLTMMRTATQRAALLATVIAAGCLIAACGSSSSRSSTGSSSKTAASSGPSSSGTGRGANATFAACLRKHGVSFTAGGGAPGGGTPPSGAPGSGGTPAGAGSMTGGPPSGVPGSRAGGSKFQAALKACGAKLPSGASPRSTGFSRQAIQKYVSCVRQHGYKLLNPNLSGTGPVFPSSIRSNAKFQAASRRCQDLLAPAPGTGGPGSS